VRYSDIFKFGLQRRPRTAATYAALTALTGQYVGEQVYCSGVGAGGSWWFWAGSVWRPISGSYLHYSLSSAVTSDGTGNDQILDYTEVPAGLLSAGTSFEVDLFLFKSGASDNFAAQLRFGTAHTTADVSLGWSSAAMTGTTKGIRPLIRFTVVNDTTIRAVCVNGAAGTGATTVSIADATVPSLAGNTNYLSFSAQRTSGTTETLTLYGYQVRVNK
jgi:hypothetical protein